MTPDNGNSSPLTASNLVVRSPELAAAMSKFVATKDPIEKEMQQRGTGFYLDRGEIIKISDWVKNRLKDNENILKLFPEIELAKQIIVASVQSPKDMLTKELHFKPLESMFPPAIQSKLTQAIESYFTKKYDLKAELPDIIRNVTFDQGSHINLILPENLLDEIINGGSALSLESASPLFSPRKSLTEPVKIAPLGFFGEPAAAGTMPRLALESLLQAPAASSYDPRLFDTVDGARVAMFEGLVELNDNYNILKIPAITSALTSRLVTESIQEGARGVKGHVIPHREFKDLVFKGNNQKVQTTITIGDPSNAKRKSATSPLVLRIHPRGCIPVCIPGKENEAEGYILMVDADGSFVSETSLLTSADTITTLLADQKNSENLAGGLLNRAAGQIVGDDKKLTLAHVTKFTSTLVEKNIVEKLRHGRYKRDLDVKLSEDASRVMLFRILSGKFTRLVYVPKELMTYYAIKYDVNGIGLSYLDEVKMLTSIRGIVLFARIMSRVRNSINARNVKLKLDPRDPDPEGHIAESVSQIMDMMTNVMPFGTNSMPELARWVQSAGIQLSFENHPGIPDVSYEFTSDSGVKSVTPEDDLDEMLRVQTFLAFGLTPEQIDDTRGSNFAITVSNNSIMFAKRVQVIQDALCPLMSDFHRKMMRYDPGFKDEILEIFTTNKADIIQRLDDEAKVLIEQNEAMFWENMYEAFLLNQEVRLPTPSETTIKTQSESFNEYSNFVDKAIDTIISGEFLPADMLGEWANKIDMLKAAYKNYLLREFLVGNNSLPELFKIITTNEENQPTLNLAEEYRSHFEMLAASVIGFHKNYVPLKLASSLDMDKISKMTSPPTDAPAPEGQQEGEFSSVGADTQDAAGIQTADGSNADNLPAF